MRSGDGSIVGFISVFSRRAFFADIECKAGVPGDLIIDRPYRSIGNAIKLMSAPITPVTANHHDLLVAQGNEMSSPLIRRIGYREIGRWGANGLLRRSQRKLREQIGPAATFVGPAVNAWTAFLLRRVAVPAGYAAIKLERNELDHLDLGRWKHSSSVLLDYAECDLDHRFQQDPRFPTDLIGVKSKGGGYVAYAALARRPNGAATVRQLHVDHDHLTYPQAIRVVVDFANCDMLTINLLENGPLRRELIRMGFVSRRPLGQSVVAYWKDSHDLAPKFEDTSNWLLFNGFMDV